METALNNPAVAGEEVPLTLKERKALIERVAGSEQFARSARLREFLLYVGMRSLQEGSPEIRELEIGIKVFGRSEDYDRGADNIVRVNATELRKRVGLYFESAGASEPFILEIPRGGYRLVFRPRRAEQSEDVGLAQAGSVQGPASAAVATDPANAAASWQVRNLILPAVVVCLAIAGLATAGGMLYLQNRAMRRVLYPWDSQPALAAFWGGFLDSHRQTDLVLPDDSTSVMEDITRNPVSLDDYINRTFVGQIQSSHMSEDRKEDVNQVLSHDLVTFGSVRAAQSLLDAIPAAYPRNLTLSRYFTSDQVKRENVILIGGKKSLPWDYLFRLNFVTDFDYARGMAIVRNYNPRSGEQSIYSNAAASAVIAYLPNPSHTGKVILLAGIDSDATGAAAAFLTSEKQMEAFLGALRSRQFPYFEVLLKSSRMSGTVFDTELVAYRAYPNLH